MSFNPFRSRLRIHPSYLMIDSLLDDGPRPRRRVEPIENRGVVLRWALPFFFAAIVWTSPRAYKATAAWLTSDSLAISRLESDMSAMKKIVSGIVPAVKQLAAGRSETVDTIDSQETKLAVVTTSRANIRRDPALDAQSIMTINQGSVLLIRASEGEWIQVLTPLGEPGWMHRSVLRVE